MTTLGRNDKCVRGRWEIETFQELRARQFANFSDYFALCC
jgi:hypothetical protein